jgi:hypothetical protein
MYQASGRVWVGPGVEETGFDTVGVAAPVVTAGVGVGVAGGVAGCVHPAARASTAQRTSADTITSVLFIPDNYIGGYLMIVSFLCGKYFPRLRTGTNTEAGMLLTHAMTTALKKIGGSF